MKDYSTLTAEQLLNDPQFRNWLIAPNEVNEQFWKDFLIRFPEKQLAVRTAKAMYLALNQMQEVPGDEQGEHLWERIRQEIEQDSSVPELELAVPEPNLWRRWIAAASILFLLSAGGWYFWKITNVQSANTYEGQVAGQTENLIEKVNRSQQAERIELPDGSIVKLFPSGRVSYQAQFTSQRREIFMSGKAYFEVVEDEQRPFLVYANGLVTQVVGTSFTIDSPSATVMATVAVSSGKVKVFTLENFQKNQRGERGEVTLLTPNQQLTFDPQKALVTRQIVKEPLLLNPPKVYPNFYFENTSVVHVFKTLEESYGVTIQYDHKTISDCSVTAPLGTEPLFRKLDIICQTIGATYEVYGSEIIVKGSGCGN
ncbi:FecR family protein [Arundinibacter roseus]|uniref:FecR family protein n=1 Tax=Arundinibacter roseus TaxID=2070510 RepID=UPI001404B06F|nr:FecR family protein [Arundinibacter roseus]